MIAEFLRSWALFHNAYLAGWLIAALLGLSGVIVVARNHIFIGAAVAQASTLGIALGMWLGAALHIEVLGGDHAHGVLSFIGVGFAIAAALITAREGPSGAREAATGWVFLAAGSLAILVLAHSPHGLEEIEHLVSSSIIGATPMDVLVFAALTATAVIAVWAARDRLMLFASDPAMAAAVGMRTTGWRTALAVWLGLVVGLAMRVTGLLYTFGCLVLPAMAAAALCRETASLFWVAPLIAIACSAVGFVLANHFDDPPGQMAVAVQAVLVAAVWAVRSRRRAPG
ncbi:MAG: metal ABC transporter permease [Candidatus Binatia bacterium]